MQNGALVNYNRNINLKGIKVLDVCFVACLAPIFSPSSKNIWISLWKTHLPNSEVMVTLPRSLAKGHVCDLTWTIKFKLMTPEMDI